MAIYYGIPLKRNVESGPTWNPQSNRWDSTFVDLPIANNSKIILVPKVMVRQELAYRYDSYYTHYLLPEMQQAELNANSGLVELLKNGSRRVTKKALKEKYGNSKLAVINQTLRFPHVLDEYREDTKNEFKSPLTLEEMADLTGSKAPDWNQLISDLKKVKPGRDDAGKYENIIENILTALFYPSLCNPKKQTKIHDGRKRIDISYSNEAKSGFFYWLSLHYPSSFIFAECKNYGRDIANPEVDQLSGRFSPGRGKVGLLLHRYVTNKKLLAKRLNDTAIDDRGFIIALTDEELIQLMEEARDNPETTHEFPLLKEKFSDLVN